MVTNIKSKLKKPLIVLATTLALILSAPGISTIDIADAAYDSVTGTESIRLPSSGDSGSRTQSTTVTIPDLYSANATVNTGYVSVTKSGNNATITASNGSYVRSSSGSYWSDYAYYHLGFVRLVVNKLYPHSDNVGPSTFPATYNYDYNEYKNPNLPKKGSQYRELESGSPAGSKFVTNQPSQYYSTDSDGYSGVLSEYVVSGTPADTKTVTHVRCSYSDADWVPYKPSISSTCNHTSGGYLGSISMESGPFYNEKIGPDGETLYKVYAYYGGTVTRPDTQVYAYQGTVSKPDDRMYKWYQEYEGSTWKAGYVSYTNYYYAYNITLNYVRYQRPTAPTNVNYNASSVKDNHQKVITWSPQSFNLGGSGNHQRVEFYNGNSWVNISGNLDGSVTSYTHTISGSLNTNSAKYRVGTCKNEPNGVLDCNYNTGSNFTVDNSVPSTPVITANTSWSNTNESVSITGGNDPYSGVNRTEYKLIGVETKDWTTYTGPFTITTDGQTTVYARTIDNLGFISNESSKVIKVDKQIPTSPSITVTSPTSYDGSWTASDVKYILSDSVFGPSGKNRIEYKESNGSWKTYSGEVTVSRTFKGIIYSRAISNSNTISSITETPFNVSVDKTLPVNFSTNVKNINNNSLTIHGTTTDSDSGLHSNPYRYFLDGTLIQDWKSSNEHVVNNLQVNKQYTLGMEIRDLVSNITKATDIKKYTLSNPVTLTIKNIQSTSIGLDVNVSGNPANTQYLLERSTSSTFSSSVVKLINWSTTSTVNDTGLQPGNTYYYRVKSRNGDNVETSYSQTYTVTTVPGVPTGLSVTIPSSYDSNSGRTFNISWNTVTGADGYKLYESDIEVSDIKVPSNKLTINNLIGNKLYTYKIDSYNENGSSAKSTAVSKRTRATNPTSLKQTTSTANSVTFDIVEGINDVTPQYYIYATLKGAGASASKKSQSAYSKNTTNRVLSGLTPGVEYEAWLITRNEDGVANEAIKLVDEFTTNRPPEVTLNMPQVKYSERPGFNVIDIAGIWRDQDLMPVADTVNMTYKITNLANNTVVSQGNILTNVKTTGNNTNFSHKLDVGSWIPEGNFKVDLSIKDKLNFEDTATGTFLVDKTNPTGQLNLITTGEFNTSLSLTADNYDIAGKPTNYVRYIAYSESYNNGTSEKISWTNQNNVSINNLKPHARYEFKAELRDQVDNISLTNSKVMVTKPSINEKADKIYYTDDMQNRLEFVFTRNIDSDASVEIYRNNYLVANIVSGNKFVDENLDYERDYDYKFITVSKDESGNRIESIPLTLKAKTGEAKLGLYVEDNFYTTVFSDTVFLKGEVEYRYGGEVNISVENTGNSFNFITNPNVKTSFNKNIILKPGNHNVVASMSRNGIFFSAKQSINVSKKPIKIGKRDASVYGIYN